jgi:hypothetical protein
MSVTDEFVCAVTARPGDNNIRVTFAIDLNNDLKVLGPVLCKRVWASHKCSCVQHVGRTGGNASLDSNGIARTQVQALDLSSGVSKYVLIPAKARRRGKGEN